MCLLKFQKQMILSKWNGWIHTLELEEEALRNDSIETNQGWCRTAIPKMYHLTGAAKI